MSDASAAESNPEPRQSVIVGFDPGREKCGVAVMGLNRTLYLHEVVRSEVAIATLNTLCTQYSVPLIVLGNQTTSKEWQQRLESLPPTIVPVDERYSTLEARDRYWQMYPPRGLSRLWPQGLRTPPRPIDDLVAIILIERYLESVP
ncbi:Putative pre-16S rRNA nuclease [Acaryochloris thomasi RCC1774]|uniref:Pre-16S rRNA nuclease n=1 Tax=Acaryochloris thomasi RCC1774 TaxID=1764569 RepID=A0A2W1JND8_9CYAN|nr:pre-16S rRNA-processing nuclease YqgF [Acaryochloris thomasi]PZD74850.1 Putative pre-16S rRNA nuclease [Acaryochloris thomasi RCC1774]